MFIVQMMIFARKVKFIWGISINHQGTFLPTVVNNTKQTALIMRNLQDFHSNPDEIRILREKFYPEPGLKPRPLAFSANALTNWAIQDKYESKIELIS